MMEEPKRPSFNRQLCHRLHIVHLSSIKRIEVIRELSSSRNTQEAGPAQRHRLSNKGPLSQAVTHGTFVQRDWSTTKMHQGRTRTPVFHRFSPLTSQEDEGSPLFIFFHEEEVELGKRPIQASNVPLYGCHAHI